MRCAEQPGPFHQDPQAIQDEQTASVMFDLCVTESHPYQWQHFYMLAPGCQLNCAHCFPPPYSTEFSGFQVDTPKTHILLHQRKAHTSLTYVLERDSLRLS
jgi:hypothetical protein